MAHGDLVYGAPGPGDYVASGGTLLRLEMSAVKKGEPVHVALLDDRDEPLPVGTAIATRGVASGARSGVEYADVCVRVEPMKPGVHAVEYTAVAVDGHRLRGRYLFEVAKTRAEPTDRVDPGVCAGADLAEPGPARTLAEMTSGSAVPPWSFYALGAAIVLAGVGVIVRALRDRRPAQDSRHAPETPSGDARDVDEEAGAADT